jgi:predicted transposase YdaD
LSQEEIGKMFELNDLRQTRFFQDVFEEGKKKVSKKFLKKLNKKLS